MTYYNDLWAQWLDYEPILQNGNCVVLPHSARQTSYGQGWLWHADNVTASERMIIGMSKPHIMNEAHKAFVERQWRLYKRRYYL